MSVAWARIAETWTWRSASGNHPHLRDLIIATQGAVRASDDARAIANTFWAVAKLGQHQDLFFPLAGLRQSLCEAVQQTAKQMSTQESAKVIWGIAALSEPARSSVLNVLPMFEERVKETRLGQMPFFQGV